MNIQRLGRKNISSRILISQWMLILATLDKFFMLCMKCVQSRHWHMLQHMLLLQGISSLAHTRVSQRQPNRFLYKVSVLDVPKESCPATHSCLTQHRSRHHLLHVIKGYGGAVEDCLGSVESSLDAKGRSESEAKNSGFVAGLLDKLQGQYKNSSDDLG
ncbi:hypothetical protein VNO80_21144 [Phaseolus coccineus]|uniref:Uncharacterized protein n=1 Tax=Phaseolus coccineus TaxID=3886 RepID=A0AAN9M2H2_PHACN